MLAQPTATTTNRTTVTTTMVSVLRVPCLAGIRWLTPAERARVQSPSPSCVGPLFVSPSNIRSAKFKTGPAGLVGRKVPTPRRIICYAISRSGRCPGDHIDTGYRTPVAPPTGFGSATSPIAVSDFDPQSPHCSWTRPWALESPCCYYSVFRSGIPSGGNEGSSSNKSRILCICRARA